MNYSPPFSIALCTFYSLHFAYLMFAIISHLKWFVVAMCACSMVIYLLLMAFLLICYVPYVSPVFLVVFNAAPDLPSKDMNWIVTLITWSVFTAFICFSVDLNLKNRKDTSVNPGYCKNTILYN